MPDFSRREFLKRSAAAGVAGGVALMGFGKNAGASDIVQVGTMIDLTRCDGCRGLDTPDGVKKPAAYQLFRRLYLLDHPDSQPGHFPGHHRNRSSPWCFHIQGELAHAAGNLHG